MVCILIAGPPASGKSTLAARLSAALGIPVLSKDAIKERLFDEVGFTCREEKVRLGRAASAIQLEVARASFACGKSVMLEDNFERATRNAVRQTLHACGCPALTVLLRGEMPALYERFVRRDESPLRHRGHVVNDRYPELPGQKARRTTPALEDFAQSIARRGMDEPPLEDGPCITVDVTDLAAVDWDGVVARVRAWVAENGG